MSAFDLRAGAGHLTDVLVLEAVPARLVRLSEAAAMASGLCFCSTMMRPGRRRHVPPDLSLPSPRLASPRHATPRDAYLFEIPRIPNVLGTRRSPTSPPRAGFSRSGARCWRSTACRSTRSARSPRRRDRLVADSSARRARDHDPWNVQGRGNSSSSGTRRPETHVRALPRVPRSGPTPRRRGRWIVVARLRNCRADVSCRTEGREEIGLPRVVRFRRRRTSCQSKS
jgi:hypothetical protein